MQEQLYGHWDIFNEQSESLHHAITFTPEGNWRRVYLPVNRRGDLMRGLFGASMGGRYRIEEAESDKPWLVLAIYDQQGGLAGNLADKVLRRNLPVWYLWLLKQGGILIHYSLLQIEADTITAQRIEDGVAYIEYWRRRQYPI
jgi:hypothetical protein